MRKVLGIFVFLFLSIFSFATHQIGGLITYKCLGGYTYLITVTNYTNTYSTPADRDTMRIWWGDNTGNMAKGSTLVYRDNGLPNYLIPGDTTPNGEALCDYFMSTTPPEPLQDARKVSIYQAIHTYPGPGNYHIWVADPDRMASIGNISYSVGVVYYMYASININPEVPVCINSPVITNSPVCQYGCTGKCYTYNPGAYIPDLPHGSDDSISYSLGSSLTLNPNAPDGEEIAPGYYNPGAIINDTTGTLKWCNTQPGIWNFVILMTTYQRVYETSGGYTIKTMIPVDTVELELEVIITGSCSDPVVNSNDTCLEAGGTATIVYTAKDPGNYLYITAAGEPFSLTPPATLSVSGGPHYSPVTTVFNWTTNCNDVRVNPYQVVIRATQDQIVSGPPPDTNFYSGYGTSSITVVGPAPKNLKADVDGTTVCLHWNPSICPKDTIYNIYRQKGCSGWKHGYCETGVPAYTGYTLIGTNYGINDTTFCDSNGGAGLSPGVAYSYIIDGAFPLPDGSQSYASNDTCITIKLGVPLITNVSVTKTDPAHGEMFIRWMKPLADTSDLDTSAYKPPYKYVLLHTTGMSSSSGFTPIATYTTMHFNTAIDTTFMDTGLNTQNNSYNYKIDFYDSAAKYTFLGSSGTASSIYLKLQRGDQLMQLGWSASVPWVNDTFYVYRLDPPPATTYNYIGKTIHSTYIDSGLHNGSQYCYYVKSYSQYLGVAGIHYPLFDSSETICGTPEDTIAPCSPPLYIGAKCSLYEDSVVWSNPNRLCPRANKVVSYQVLYSPVENGTMEVIATFNSPEDTVFVNDNLTSIAGCYAVIAIDSAGQKSPLNSVCVDNCPNYELPNVFSPNGDGVNDLFTPIEPYRYVKSIDINIYNRWGQKMFYTSDPSINWNGNVNNSGGPCPDGVYYYICIVNEIRISGIVPITLKGFIQLIR